MLPTVTLNITYCYKVGGLVSSTNLTLRDRFSLSLYYKFATMQFEFTISAEGSNILLSLYCLCLCL